MFTTGVIFVLLGGGLWLLSRMGVAVGSHPFCRGCGFDLYMLPEDSRRCPECGADTLAEDAITIGRRRPVRSGMVAGAAGVVLGAALLGLAGVAWWDRFDGSRFKTTAMVARDVMAPEAGARRRSCAELQRRAGARELTSAQIERVAQEILKRQADPAAAWDPRWGDLVQGLHVASSPGGGTLLAPHLWEQFLRQGMELSARVRPRVRSGDPLPIGVTCRLKLGTKWVASRAVFVPEVTATCGAASGKMTGWARESEFMQPLEWTVYWQPVADAESGGALAAGSQEVRLGVTMTAQDQHSAIARTAQFAVPVVVLERGGSSVAFQTPTEQGRRDFEAALQWRLREGEDGTIALAGGTLGHLWISGPPVTAAFRVVLRQAGAGGEPREWVLARIMVRPDDAALVPLALPAGGGPVAGAAEIVCVPDGELAADTVEVMEVWGGEERRGVRLGR